MAYAAPVFLQAQSAITTPDQINPVGVLVVSSQLLGTYFHCVWCCTALFIYEGHLILLSDWVKSKQASFQSLLFLFISQCPQQQSDCATFWGMMRKPCPHPLSSPRWTRYNTRATSWSGENQLGRKTYTQTHHLLEIKNGFYNIKILLPQFNTHQRFVSEPLVLLSSVAIKLPSRDIIVD